MEVGTPSFEIWPPAILQNDMEQEYFQRSVYRGSLKTLHGGFLGPRNFYGDESKDSYFPGSLKGRSYSDVQGSERKGRQR